MRNYLERKVIEESMSEFVIFYGSVAYEHVSDVFKMADIYVIPSLYEGTLISLLEAMYNELPIIGSNTQGIHNIISNEKNGLLFEKGNPSDLRKKIIVLSENERLCEEIGKKAKETYESSYNYDNIIDFHIQLYKNISG